MRCLTLVDTDVLLYVPAAVVTCCYYGVVAVLRLVVVLLLLLPLCTKKLNKHVRRENEYTGVQKQCRKQRKAGKVQQVLDGGGAQVGTSERPGRCQPSPLKKKSRYVYKALRSAGGISANWRLGNYKSSAAMLQENNPDATRMSIQRMYLVSCYICDGYIYIYYLSRSL